LTIGRRRLAVCLFLQLSAPVPHSCANPSDLLGLRPVASELPVGKAVHAGKSVRKDRPVEASVGLRSQSDQLFLAVSSACQDPSEVKVVASLASAERNRGFGRHGVSFRERRTDGKLDRLALTEVRQVHHCDVIIMLSRHLEPGEGVGLPSDDDDHAGLLLGPAHSLHPMSEVLHIPAVSKQVHVFAHALHQAMSLQRVAAREGETILAETTQPDTGQSVL
jgi:hypothetical protein